METIGLKKKWRILLAPYTNKSNATAYFQLISTSALYALAWYSYSLAIQISLFFAIPYALIVSFLILRFFVLMHDCGHGSLFDSPKLNKTFGLLLGVITGMPQYVWSKHHAYHHTTNGDWQKYKGPLSIVTTEEYQAFNPKQKRLYRLVRNPFLFVPIGGFLYVLFNPRFNWLVGSIKLFALVIKQCFTQSPKTALATLKLAPSKKWKSAKEFRHMTYNNLLLLGFWFLMIQALGAFHFFLLYVTSLSLAGGLGILFFTVQHNFEHSYASDTENVDYFKAALEGTSYLKLPSLLNWFTADIAYHHIHHLSTAVPNYQLKKCHRNLKGEFTMVKRISLSEIPQSIEYILWDKSSSRLVTIKEFETTSNSHFPAATS